jgi:hypothetical protein
MLRILSLGAGVQSTTLALMVAHGELEPIDCAIFSDTQSEPEAVLAATVLRQTFDTPRKRERLHAYDGLLITPAELLEHIDQARRLKLKSEAPR